MKEHLTTLKHYLQPLYFVAAFLLYLVFNSLLIDVLHEKVHSDGAELAKQVYQLNIDPQKSPDLIAALVKNKGFVMDINQLPSHLVGIIDVETEVFNYKTVNLKLFHLPAWLVESHLFIFFNCVLLGAGWWGYRWLRLLTKREVTFEKDKSLSGTQTQETKALNQCAKLEHHQDINTLYGLPVNVQNIFALFFWQTPFPDNLDLASYFKVVIAKGFADVTKHSCKVLPSGGVAITLSGVLTGEVNNYCQRLHRVLFDACAYYRPDLSRSHVKVGICNYRNGADQTLVYQLTKSALAVAKQSSLDHVHRLAYGHTEDNVFADSEQQLSSYIQKKQFMLFFQPLFELTSGEILQHEALIRVRHKNLGLMSARHFIPHLSSNQDIFLLDQTVIERVKKMLSSDRQALKVSINLHTLNWFNRDFWLWMNEQFEPHSLATKLQFEVSEDDFFTHSDLLNHSFLQLQALGASVAIDNVSKYEKIALLNLYTNVSSIKLAYELIHNIDTKLAQQKVVKKIVAKGFAINVPVYAVGVETQSELETLKKLGVMAAQGFYFSEPLQKLADIS